jgi:hypothetical protein
MATTNDLQRVFPAAAPVLRITTDTDNLYIHNVETADGKLWTLIVKRWDANGNIIRVTDENNFPVPLVHEIMALARMLLDPSVYVPEDGKMLCFSTDGDKVNYFQQEEASEDENASAPKKEYIAGIQNCPRDKMGDKGGGKSAAILASLHELFFERVYKYDPKESIRPTYEPPASKPIKPKYIEKVVSEDSAKPDAAVAPRKTKKVKKPSPKKKVVPEDMLDYMPQSIRDKEQGGVAPSSTLKKSAAAVGNGSQASASTQSIPPAADYMDELIQKIDHPTRQKAFIDELFKKPDSEPLKGLKYKTLHDYSMRKDHNPSDEHYPLYESFKRLLVNNSNQSGDEELFNWLMHYYWEAYQYHLSKKDEFEGMYEADCNHPDLQYEGTYDDWCRGMGASAVAGFIRVEDIDGSNLILALQEKANLLLSPRSY